MSGDSSVKILELKFDFELKYGHFPKSILVIQFLKLHKTVAIKS